jgi:hypothetical protein
MSRKHIDCREFSSESGCTVAISADTEDELAMPPVSTRYRCTDMRIVPSSVISSEGP